MSGTGRSEGASGEEIRVTFNLGGLALTDKAKRRVEKVLTAALEAELRSQPTPQFDRRFYIIIE